MKHVAFSRRFFIQTITLVVFISFYFFLTIHFEVFSYQNITCSYAKQMCSEPIMAELNRLKGQSLFSLNLQKTIFKIKKSNPEMSRISIQKQFPNSLSVEIHKQPLVMKIICPNIQLGLSKEGFIHESTLLEAEDLPSIEASESVCTHLQSDAYLDSHTQKELLTFLQEMRHSFPDHNLLWENDATVLLTNSQQQRVIISTNTLSYQLHIYKLLTSEQHLPEQWKSLDLRFQKAIVTTQ